MKLHYIKTYLHNLIKGRMSLLNTLAFNSVINYRILR